jgi:hypothetical protein
VTDVYKQHDSTFRDVSAWVITKDGERVATFACKYGRGGASGVTVTAYLHVLGLPMVRHREGPGGGYDMKSAAFRRAAEKIMHTEGMQDDDPARLATICFREYPDEGDHWDTWLRRRGYEVLQAV